MTDLSTIPDHALTPASRPLRRVLRANAFFSLTSGVAFLAAGAPVARLLGTPEVGLLRLLGVGLLGFGYAVFLLQQRASPARLAAGALAVSIADYGWVVGTAAVVAAGWLEFVGAVVMLGVAVIVGAFGSEQLRRRAAIVRSVRGPVPARTA